MDIYFVTVDGTLPQSILPINLYKKIFGFNLVGCSWFEPNNCNYINELSSCDYLLEASQCTWFYIVIVSQNLIWLCIMVQWCKHMFNDNHFTTGFFRLNISIAMSKIKIRALILTQCNIWHLQQLAVTFDFLNRNKNKMINEIM